MSRRFACLLDNVYKLNWFFNFFAYLVIQYRNVAPSGAMEGYESISYSLLTKRTMVQRKKYASVVNFYVTDGQKKKIEYILEQKGQNLTDFLRGYIQATVEKYEDKNGAINIYQTYIV